MRVEAPTSSPPRQRPGRRRRRPALLLALGAAFLFGLGSCCNRNGANRASSVDEVGSLRISVLARGHWSTYVDSLAPHFTITGDTALTKVLPTTRLRDVRRVTRTAGELTVTAGPEGSVPGLGDAEPSDPAPKRTAEELTTRGGLLDTTLGTDPMMQYWAATALFQEVKLLDRYVADAALRSGYEPYLVRLGVGQMTRRRDMPYDAFLYLSFFPEEEADEVDVSEPSTLPLVLPMLVTDNLETTLHASTTDQIRQFALGLQAMASSKVNVGGEFQRYAEDLEKLVAKNLNSVLTVSRLSDNSLIVRLGALQQGETDFAMVPRNQHVTLLLMVPRCYFAKDLAKCEAEEPQATHASAETTPEQQPARLAVRTYVEYLDVDTGEKLGPKPKEREDQQVAALRDFYGLTPVFDFDEAWNEILGNHWKEFRQRVDADCGRHGILELAAPDLEIGIRSLHSVAVTTAGKITVSKSPFCAAGGTEHRYRFAQQLWQDIASLNTSYTVDRVVFELKPPPEKRKFPKQTALLVDDGSKTETRLYGISGYRTKDVCAAIWTGRYRVSARRISVEEGGSWLFEFPSLSRWEIGPTATVLRGSVRLGYGKDCWSQHEDDTSKIMIRYLEAL